MPRRNPASNPDTTETLDLPLEQAIARIKASRNRAFFIRTDLNAPVAAEPGKVFLLGGNVKVNAATAVEYLRHTYTGRFATEALVPVVIYQNCFFIG